MERERLGSRPVVPLVHFLGSQETAYREGDGSRLAPQQHHQGLSSAVPIHVRIPNSSSSPLLRPLVKIRVRVRVRVWDGNWQHGRRRNLLDGPQQRPTTDELQYIVRLRGIGPNVPLKGVR